MKKKYSKAELPKELPVFPLSNAIFFPKTLLPLNIFEPRYKQMTEHALEKDNLIGMIQSNQKVGENNIPEVYDIGCVIVGYQIISTSDHAKTHQQDQKH